MVKSQASICRKEVLCYICPWGETPRKPKEAMNIVMQDKRVNKLTTEDVKDSKKWSMLIKVDPGNETLIFDKFTSGKYI